MKKLNIPVIARRAKPDEAIPYEDGVSNTVREIASSLTLRFRSGSLLAMKEGYQTENSFNAAMTVFCSSSVIFV